MPKGDVNTNGNVMHDYQLEPIFKCSTYYVSAAYNVCMFVRCYSFFLFLWAPIARLHAKGSILIFLCVILLLLCCHSFIQCCCWRWKCARMCTRERTKKKQIIKVYVQMLSSECVCERHSSRFQIQIKICQCVVINCIEWH